MPGQLSNWNTKIYAKYFLHFVIILRILGQWANRISKSFSFDQLINLCCPYLSGLGIWVNFVISEHNFWIFWHKFYLKFSTHWYGSVTNSSATLYFFDSVKDFCKMSPYGVICSRFHLPHTSTLLGACFVSFRMWKIGLEHEILIGNLFNGIYDLTHCNQVLIANLNQYYLLAELKW